jgi:hypothetical protein
MTKDKKPLASLHWRVYGYLKDNCIGKDNSVSMVDLASWYGISTRKVREVIKDLTESDTIYTVIATTSKGYYLPSNELEMGEANKMLKSRIKGALTRYFANTPNDRDWLYNLIAELKNEYDTPPQAQMVIKFTGHERDTINYFGERKDQKAYDSLFDFVAQKN